MLHEKANGEDSDSDFEDEAEETALESYNTPLDNEESTVDEYQIFVNSLKGMHNFAVVFQCTNTKIALKYQKIFT